LQVPDTSDNHIAGMAQRVSKLLSFTLADLEEIPWVPRNPPFKDKLVPKNLFDLAQLDLHTRKKCMFEIVSTTYLPW